MFRDQKRLQSTPLPGKPNPQSYRLSWCAFVVRQNFSNCCRKVIDAGTRYDDAVAATMSFFCDAQESPALVFSELHVKMLALYLQFSRLDDVIHFCLRPPTLAHPIWGMEAKSARFFTIFGKGTGSRLTVARLAWAIAPNPQERAISFEVRKYSAVRMDKKAPTLQQRGGRFMKTDPSLATRYSLRVR